MSNYILSAVLMVINQKQTNWETSEICITPYERMRTVTAASSLNQRGLTQRQLEFVVFHAQM